MTWALWSMKAVLSTVGKMDRNGRTIAWIHYTGVVRADP
jgi:hypothetical protein